MFTLVRAASHRDCLHLSCPVAQLLTRLSYLVLDHSMSWPARQAAADLLSDLVLRGGKGAEAAVASGAYAGLVEMLNRDMFPFLNQVSRCNRPGIPQCRCRCNPTVSGNNAYYLSCLPTSPPEYPPSRFKKPSPNQGHTSPARCGQELGAMRGRADLQALQLWTQG